MPQRKPTESDKKRCVVLFRYRKLNEKTIIQRHNGPHGDKPFVEVEFGSEGDDFSQQYRIPKITQTAGAVEVRVYDDTAVSFASPVNLLGDYSDALDRCEEALAKEGFEIVPLS